MGAKQVPDIVKKRVKASVTVEAALAFPIFILACVSLCYLFLFMRAEYVIQRELYYTARELSEYGGVIEPVANIRNKALMSAEASIYGSSENVAVSLAIEALTSLLPDGGNGISLKNLVTNTVDSIIFEKLIDDRLPADIKKYMAAGGVNCDGSILYGIDKCLVIRCSYSFKISLGIFPDIYIPVSHYVRYRYFTGTEVKSLLVEVKQPDDEDKPEEEKEEEEEEEYVLITETGKCYHYDYSCPALNIRPTAVAFKDVGAKRNDNGAKYYPCEFCALNKGEAVTCYITPEGDRYHFDGTCQGLKRTISKVKISEVGKRRECKRCQAYKGRTKL